MAVSKQGTKKGATVGGKRTPKAAASRSNGSRRGARATDSGGNGDGAAYLESIRDGREVSYQGERVEDLTTHPAFAPAAKVFGAMYDFFNDREAGPHVTDDAASGLRPIATYRPVGSVDDLVRVREAMERVHQFHLGFITQGPEYKGPVISGLEAAAPFFDEYADNVRKFCAEVRANRLYPANAFTDPQVDRSKRPSELANPDLILRVVDERDDGIVVRGAKMVATTVPYTNEVLVLRYGGANRLTDADRDYALIFATRTNAPGLKIIAREAFRRQPARPMDAPLSSLFDENDSILVFEDVFVPWERVFVYRDPQRADSWLQQTNIALNLVWGDMIRWGTKFEFLTALAVKICKTNGTIGFRGQQEKLGEMLAWTGTIRDLALAAQQTAEPYYDGLAVNHRIVLCFRALRPIIYKRFVETAQEIVGSGVVPIPSSLADVEMNPELCDFLQGATVDGEERVKIYKLAWDALHSDFASRQELFERLHTGNVGDVLVQLFFGAKGMEMDGLLDVRTQQLEALLEKVA